MRAFDAFARAKCVLARATALRHEGTCAVSHAFGRGLVARPSEQRRAERGVLPASPATVQSSWPCDAESVIWQATNGDRLVEAEDEASETASGGLLVTDDLSAHHDRRVQPLCSACGVLVVYPRGMHHAPRGPVGPFGIAGYRRSPAVPARPFRWRRRRPCPEGAIPDGAVAGHALGARARWSPSGAEERHDVRRRADLRAVVLEVHVRRGAARVGDAPSPETRETRGVRRVAPSSAKRSSASSSSSRSSHRCFASASGSPDRGHDTRDGGSLAVDAARAPSPLGIDREQRAVGGMMDEQVGRVRPARGPMRSSACRTQSDSGGVATARR